MRSPVLPAAVFLAILNSAQATQAPPQNPAVQGYPSRIRVRLAEAAPKVLVRGLGIQLPGAAAVAATEPTGWELRCQSGRVRAVPTRGGETLELRDPLRLRSTDGIVYFRDRPYREDLVISSVGSFCEVVNEVNLERYLAGLVNSEFSSKWNEEAIGAQIVAARTYALYQMMAARGDARNRFDVDASVRDQVYDGSMNEDARAQRLVEKTRGWVLTVGGGLRPGPLKAFYHSTCGGITELPEHVWGSSFAGFKRPVRCPFCGGSPVFSWRLDLSAAEVAAAFSRALFSDDGAGLAAAHGWPPQWRQAIRQRQLIDLRARRWDEEGRVSELLTTWVYRDAATGRATTMELAVTGARLREWVGPTRLRSASFQVAPGGRGLWRLTGRGNGHGVGMCQWGAKTMGEKGYKTASILKYYYPDATLHKLW